MKKSTLDKIKDTGTYLEATEHFLRYTLIPLFLLGFGLWFANPIVGFVFMALAAFNTVSMKVISMGIKDEFKDGADIYKNAEGGAAVNKQLAKSLEATQSLQNEIQETYMERKQLEKELKQNSAPQNDEIEVLPPTSSENSDDLSM